MRMSHGLRRAGRAIAGAVLFLGFAALAQAQNCSLASWNGTHYFLITGTGPNTAKTQLVPYAQLGKLVADGKGHLTGSATESANGLILQLSLAGTYTVSADCSGTQSLTVTPSTGSVFTSNAAFQLADGGQQKLTATLGAGIVLTGRAYPAFAEGGAQCGDGSAIGSYGMVSASPALGTDSPFSAVGGVTMDGRGGLSYKFQVNDSNSDAGGVTSQSGQGTYTISPDCSGGGSHLGGVQTFLADVVEGGNLLFLETDPGTVFSGIVQPQSRLLVVPQIAFGGAWYSALYFTNPTGGAVSFPVSFTADVGTPLMVPSLGSASTTVNIPAQGTAIVEAPNVGSLSQGYATFTMPPGVSGYGVFRQSVPGQPDQEAVAPFAVANANGSSLIWDDTNFTTAIAIANTGSVAAAITIKAWDNNGNLVGTSTMNLGPYQKTEATLRSLQGLSGVVGLRGRAFFAATTGNVAVLGLRFGTSAFTSIPAN